MLPSGDIIITESTAVCYNCMTVASNTIIKEITADFGCRRLFLFAIIARYYKNYQCKDLQQIRQGYVIHYITSPLGKAKKSAFPF